MSSGRRTAIDHSRNEQRRDASRRREDAIEELIKRCARAIERGSRKDCLYVGEKLEEELIPLLETHTEPSFYEYDRRLGGSGNWHWVALTSFLESPEAYLDRLGNGRRNTLRGIRLQAVGVSDEDATARIVIERTLESVTAIAEYEQIVMPDYANRVEVRGLSVRLGDQLQDEELDLGDPVYGLTLQSGGVKTLHGGPTGSAKSAGLERDAEDFYRYDPADPPDLDFLPDERFKLIDLVDLERGESWVYDIPQQDEDLRRIREEHGLPPDFTEVDDGRDRAVEIFAPLTPRLADLELPYDTEAERSTVQPFVIPASDIPKDLLVSTIMTRLSNSQQQTIRQAYDDVNDERADWSLANLADVIRGRPDLSDKHKGAAIGVLRSLQGESFIRTGQSEHTIDWRSVFKDTDTITVFSQATAICETTIGQLFVVAYLLDKILRVRSGEGYYELPPAVLIARELWRIVPHVKRELNDERAAAIQQFSGDVMTKALRQNRDFNLQVIGDTQKPYDLVNSVRDMFNRYVVYRGTRKLIDGVFDWTGNHKTESFARTMTTKVGQAGIVGEVQPAVDKRWVEFLSPVEWIPPSHHHFSKVREASGWLSRVEYLDREELRPAPWDAATPEYLDIESYSTASGAEDEEEDEIPPRELHLAEAKNRRRRGESYREIAENLPNNPTTGNSYSKTTIGDWVEDVEKGARLDDDE